MSGKRIQKPRPDASRAESSVFYLDSEKHRLPSSAVDLTAKERAFLKDPDWIDEDESDALIAMRREAEEEDQAIPFEEVLEEFGYEKLGD
jgi:hypothetical protein